MGQRALRAVGVAVLLVLAGGGACTTAPSESPPSADSGTDGFVDATTSVDGGIHDAEAGEANADADGGTIAPIEVDTVWGIIGTGQSLSTGASADTTINASTRYANLKLGFDYGDVWKSNGTLVYLGEPIRRPSSFAYPYNIEGETCHTIMGDEITALSLARTGKGDVTLHTVVGKSGWYMDLIEKNGIGKPVDPTVGSGYSFQAALDEVTEVKNLLAAKNVKYRIGAVVVTHGEDDFGDFNYDQRLLTLWTDYNASLKSITGFTDSIPFIVSQSSAGYPAASDPIEEIATSSVRQWVAGVVNPTAIFVAGPKHQYEYAKDNVHLTSGSQQRMGVKYGQVYDALRSGAGWKPLQPSVVSIADKVVTIDLDVPVTPIQFDESVDVGHKTIHQAWQTGRGFEVIDGTTEIEITNVVISGPKQVQITLATAPTSAARVRNALTNDGPGFHRRAQLCDSDPLAGIDKETLSVTVTSGSPTVTLAGPFKHSARDLAIGASLAKNTVITKIVGNTLSLSNPWTGPSGSAQLEFRTDQRNYLVQFETGTTYP